jgi:hypothetical protein
MFFGFTALMRRVRRLCVSDCGAGNCWRSSAAFHAVWSGWKRVWHAAGGRRAVERKSAAFQGRQREYRRFGLERRQIARGLPRMGAVRTKDGWSLRDLVRWPVGPSFFVIRSCIARGHATLATKRALPLTWAGLPLAGSHQLAWRTHSITSSARIRNDSGILRPSAFAVVRLMTSSNLVVSPC